MTRRNFGNRDGTPRKSALTGCGTSALMLGPVNRNEITGLIIVELFKNVSQNNKTRDELHDSITRINSINAFYYSVDIQHLCVP